MQNEANFAEKKVKILILLLFFEFECLNMLDIADYDSTSIVLNMLVIADCDSSNSSDLLHNH